MTDKLLNTLTKVVAIGLLALPLAVEAESLDYKPEATKGMYHPEPVRAQPKTAPEDTAFAEEFVVFQVSRSDKWSQVLALNNAANTKLAYGNQKAASEVVAYGPGLKLFLADNKHADRIERMAEQQNVQFSACANTMQAMGKTKDDLNPVVDVVSSGVKRINELQKAGWTYVRP
ncbi:DsrE family protein [Thiohalorhabdus sp.]|uniref:DsrE family protein n=1 Tax=Thiohalorhabdus sp. TaxID=3094134 RepID=UPI002FC2C2D7